MHNHLAIVLTVLLSFISSFAHPVWEYGVNVLSDYNLGLLFESAVSFETYEQLLGYLSVSPEHDDCDCDWFNTQLPGSSYYEFQYANGTVIDTDLNLFWDIVDTFQPFAVEDCDLSNTSLYSQVIQDSITSGQQFLARTQCYSWTDYDQEWDSAFVLSLGFSSSTCLLDYLNADVSSLRMQLYNLAESCGYTPSSNLNDEVSNDAVEDVSQQNPFKLRALDDMDISSFSGLVSPLELLFNGFDYSTFISILDSFFGGESQYQSFVHAMNQNSVTIAASVSFGIRNCASQADNAVCFTNYIGGAFELSDTVEDAAPFMFVRSSFDISEDGNNKARGPIIAEIGFWFGLESIDYGVDVEITEWEQFAYRQIVPKKVVQVSTNEMIGVVFSVQVTPSCHKLVFCNDDRSYSDLAFAKFAELDLSPFQNSKNVMEKNEWSSTSIDVRTLRSPLVVGVVALFSSIVIYLIYALADRAKTKQLGNESLENIALLTNSSDVHYY